jgi:hypothetical protein
MESQDLALIDNNAKHQRNPSGTSPDVVPSTAQLRRAFHAMNIATIFSGFEKGDCLVREEKGHSSCMESS